MRFKQHTGTCTTPVCRCVIPTSSSLAAWCPGTRCCMHFIHTAEEPVLCHDEGDTIRTTKHDCCRATRRNAFVLSDLRHVRSHEHMGPERIQTPRNHNSLLRTFESPAADTLAPPTLPNRLCGVGVGQLHGCVYGAETTKRSMLHTYTVSGQPLPSAESRVLVWVGK